MMSTEAYGKSPATPAWRTPAAHVIWALLIVGALPPALGGKEPHLLCASWLRADERQPVFPSSAPCPGYSKDDIDRVDFVLNRVLTRIANSFEKAPPVFPGPPVLGKSAAAARHITATSGRVVSGFVAFYPTTGDSYLRTWYTPLQLPSGWVYYYDIHRVPEGHHGLVRRKLESIGHTRFYDRVKGSENAALPFLVASDWFARYARSYDIRTEEEQQALQFPNDWAPYVTRTSIRRLWVEATVRVDDSWFPTAQPERSVVPIALETDGGLFLVSEEVRPQRMFGGTIDRFQGRAFDLSRCADIKRCAAEVAGGFASDLDAEFAKAPIGAVRARRALPPQQIRYERHMEPSEPLKGLAGPYYELTTYTLTIWRVSASNFMGTAERYFTNPYASDGPEDQIFLQLTQALQIAVGKLGEYIEPTPQQYATYAAIVDGAITNAIRSTTARFGGRFENNVGFISTVDSARK